jgi:hypothetical protein
MGQSRHPLPPPAVAAALVLFALLVAGCGSSGNGSTSEGTQGSPQPAGGAGTPTAPAGAVAQGCEGAVRGISSLRVTGVGCAIGRGVVASWSERTGCTATPPGRSRTSCAVSGYRCLGTVTDRGLAVSCARPGRSISFTAKRG